MTLLQGVGAVIRIRKTVVEMRAAPAEVHDLGATVAVFLERHAFLHDHQHHQQQRGCNCNNLAIVGIAYARAAADHASA